MMKPVLAIVFVLPCLTLIAPEASAQHKLDIPQRTCKFQTRLRITGEVKQRLEPFRPAIADVEVPLIRKTTFFCTEKGNTTGMRQWNMCRKKAYEAGMKCMRAVAANPEKVGATVGTPPECSSGPEHNKFFHTGSLGPRSAHFEGLYRHYVCVAANRWFDAHDPGRIEPATVRYQILVKAYGDKGCGGERTKKSVTHLLNTRVATCSRQRNPRSYVSLPGKRFKMPKGSYDVSYEILKSSKNTAHGCQTACRRDKRCLAWMFHRGASDKGGVKRSRGHCELIDKYLLYEPSTTVDSGMK